MLIQVYGVYAYRLRSKTVTARKGLAGWRSAVGMSCHCVLHFSDGHSRVSNIGSTFMYVSGSRLIRHGRHVCIRLWSLRLLMGSLLLRVDKNLVAERYVSNGHA